MKKVLLIATCAVLGIAMPALAQESDSQKLQDIHSDANAVNKDNQAIQNDNNSLANDRAAKAQDKASGNWGKQAVDSTKIGVDKTAKSEKSMEKSTDQDSLNHDMNK
jgi:hypothetical protein